GFYTFTTLAPGVYTVTVTAPDGYVFSQPNVGSDPTRESDADATGVMSSTTLASGDEDLTWDAGLYRGAALGDRVWNDLNANGVQDAGEPGVPDVTLTLTGVDGFGTTVSLTTTTDVNGIYTFTKLVPGVYTVTATLPDGYAVTTRNAGSSDANDSDATTSGVIPAIMLTSGQTDLTWDLGLFQRATLGDRVWDDLDANGRQDADEPGLPAVTLTLTGVDGFGRTVSLTTTTDATGIYTFTNLVPGVYTVTVTTPDGYVVTQPTIGEATGNSDADASGVMTGITLTSGQTDLTWDAGLYRGASLGNLVWDDTNGNGVQNSGENGIADVLVTLTGVDSLGATVSLT
ncbi:SdrD B-like domain-containing protein, partial [Candidatus Chloroploca sp. Khr17]|uniref:SdrD B-like domain-containing protein n=1 Tax=Candidatus Chloroploca sp. Khr17 TaxID=2496869 RepID=UPI002102DA58